MNASPDPSEPTGDLFGASGSANSTLIGPVVAGIEQALSSPNLGMAVNEDVGSTDGTATGTFSYVHDFGTEAAAPARQIPSGVVSYAAGSTTLTATAGTFNPATDVGLWVAGPSGQIDPASQITAVAADGSSATISIPTLQASTGGAIGLGRNITRVDPAFSTGDVFTTNGVDGGEANIGVIGVTSVTVHAAIDIPFGGAQGVGSSNCLLTGWDAANNPGPAQTGSLTPALPPGNTTPLVLASGGFITQPGTDQAITPPAAAFVSLQAPVAALSITTTTLPNGTVGDPYSATLEATGGTTPYSWSVSAGTLPDGLTLNASTGEISGTPTTAGTFNFTVMVTDSTAPTPQTDTADLSITIAPVAVVDGALDVIVNGPTRTAAGDKTIVGKVTNLGTGPFTVCDTDISWVISVNGAPTMGAVDALRPGCKDLGPGASTRFRFRWTYGAGEVSPGAMVDYTGTVNVAGDVDLTNNSETESRTAR